MQIATVVMTMQDRSTSRARQNFVNLKYEIIHMYVQRVHIKSEWNTVVILITNVMPKVTSTQSPGTGAERTQIPPSKPK